MPKARINNLTRYGIDHVTGCWIWGGPIHPSGYGKTSRTMHGTRWAHRVIYIEHVGPVPGGLTLDHLCRNPICVNPAHLEPVTIRENTLRGVRDRMRGRCLKGLHDITTPGALLTDSTTGRHTCRECRRASKAAYRKRHRAQLLTAA